MTSTSQNEGTRAPRRAWIVVAILAGVLGLANAVGVVVLLVHARWIETLLGLLSVLTAYWFSMGAWRRTPWGLVTPDDAPPDPPGLSARRARLYTTIAVACAGAAAISVVLQEFALSR